MSWSDSKNFATSNFRVFNAIALLLQFPRHRLGGFDIPILTALVAAAEQNDDLAGLLDEIDPVAGADMQAQLADAITDRAHVAKIASGEPVDPPGDRQPRDPI